MIKNWTVKVKQIRNSGYRKKYKKVINKDGSVKYKATSAKGRKVINGFINHVNYLKDKNRAAHKDTKITVLLNNAQNILNAIEERKLFRQSKGLVGGGVRNFASSIVCVIPNHINQPKNINEWSRISSRVIFDIAKTTNLPFDVIKKHTHIVLHDESASPDKHSHIHVLVSNVINNEVVKVISQRKTVHAIKMGFNKSVKVVLNEDHKNYVPKNSKNFDKPLWLARQEKKLQLENDAKEIESEIKQKKLKLSKINKAIALLAKKLFAVRSEISQWADDFLNNYFSKAEIKANSVATLIDNLEPLAEKEVNEIDKTIKNIEAKNISAPEKTKISPKRKRRRRKNKNT
jgi:hypothetical protein